MSTAGKNPEAGAVCAGPATAMGGPASTSPDDLSPDRLALERKAYAKEMGQLFRGKSPTVPRQQGMGKTTPNTTPLQARVHFH